MNNICLVFPHQLFENSPLTGMDYTFYLIEEYLFFQQYNFHKQKIAFHRSSMKSYQDYLLSIGKKVIYIPSHDDKADIRVLLNTLYQKGIQTIHCIEPTDNWLEKRLNQSSIEIKYYDSPMFLETRTSNAHFFKTDKKKFFQTKFYIEQRKKWNILLDASEKPTGGKWSFDADNRKKYPKKKLLPTITFPKDNFIHNEAFQYTNAFYKSNLGEINTFPIYPTDFKSSREWLQDFLKNRFAEFGPYEDAIVAENNFLHHSVLTPMLNVGLLTPKEVIDTTLSFAKENDIPINSLEGFIRQIIGWREFIRGLYESVGTQQRTCNYWGFNRKIPSSFYTGETGILPVDLTIKKVLKTGYCHHIERLMVLGNFMLLCEFDPDEVYRWFMELFIDAYDWVMVPNVYGMSQFADGGLMATKPYISSSNYLMKMSNYPKGDWQMIWDGLFWRFMHVQRDYLKSNPRLSMLIKNYDKMDADKKTNLSNKAEEFLAHLDQQL